MSLIINADSCRSTDTGNLPDSYRLLRKRLSNYGNHYRIFNGMPLENSSDLFSAIDYDKDDWATPIDEHLKSQEQPIDVLLSALEDISKLQDSQPGEAMPIDSEYILNSEESYLWSRVSYAMSRVSRNPHCDIFLRMSARRYSSSRVSMIHGSRLSLKSVSQLVYIPDLGDEFLLLDSLIGKSFSTINRGIISDITDRLKKVRELIVSTRRELTSCLKIFTEQSLLPFIGTRMSKQPGFSKGPQFIDTISINTMNDVMRSPGSAPCSSDETTNTRHQNGVPCSTFNTIQY